METNKIRLDNFVAKKFNISRTQAKEYIKSGNILVNNQVLLKPNLLMEEDANVELIKEDKINSDNEMQPSNQKIDIVYEDDYIFIVNKPNGIIVHPTNFELTNTLANIMKRIFIEKNIPLFGDKLRNGVVHRLDKDTSGLIIVAKNQQAYETFSKLIHDKKITRKYLALMYSHLKTKTLEVQAPIKRIDDTSKREVSTDYDAQDAITIFKEQKKYNNFSLVECELLTGRTHQIRVHAEYIKNNILNDPIYGVKHLNKHTKYGQYLVAYKIEFDHPFIKNKKVCVQIDLPKEFNEYIKMNG